MKEFRHYRQPQYAATIADDNPLARGITDFQTGWNTAGWTKNAGPTQKFVADTTYANRAGLAQTFASASSQYLSKIPRTVNYPFTWGVLTKRTVVGAVTQGVMSMGAGTADRHLMYWSSDVLAMFSGAGGTVDQSVSAAGLNSTTHIYACVGVVPGQTNRVIYVDGVAGTTGTGAVNPANASTMAIGAYWSSGAPVAGFYDNANTLLAVVWNRALSVAEIKEWSLRPWQIFAPVNKRRIWSVSAGGALQTISPSGIASAEAFGTAKLNLSIAATGIASAEAFGTATLTPGAVTVSPSGIASAEAFGTAKLNLNIAPAGIASAQAFGTATLTPGAVTVSPSGIASAETFGTAKLNLQIVAVGIASAQAFGTATLTPGAVTVSPSGIASAEAFGTAKLNLQIVAVGIASAQAFGTATLTQGGVTISPSGIASAEAFGTATLTRGAVTVSPSGIASAETFGTAKLNLQIVAVGIASAQAFGTATLTPGVVTISPAGIASAEAFGTAVITGGAVAQPPAAMFTPGARGMFTPAARATFTPGARATFTPDGPSES